MLIQNVELHGQRVDLRISERIEEVGLSLPLGDDRVIDAEGGAVLPGLHDHHIHLYATAASAMSVSCRPLGVDNPQGLGELLLSVGGTGWIRAVAYHESIGGDIDLFDLDEICRHRPVRVQQASGKLWILNSMALQLLDLESMPEQTVCKGCHGDRTNTLKKRGCTTKWKQHLVQGRAAEKVWETVTANNVPNEPALDGTHCGW